MRIFKWILAMALSVSVSFSLLGQDEPLPEINDAATVAFDPGWLARYYGLDWNDDGGIVFPPARKAPWPIWKASSGRYALALRANLLHWAALTPDVGIEWRFSPRFGAMLNGAYSNWTLEGYRVGLWMVSPEVRWYFNRTKRWYLGVMGKVGQFNCRISGPGYQGDFLGGGLTVGYQMRMTRALSMDFGVGLGYMKVKYEDYDVVKGIRLQNGEYVTDLLGPVHASITFVWKLF